METPDCGEEKDARPVWLVYGGDEPTPTASTVNDLFRPAGMVIKVDGRPITLIRDSSLDLFVRRLAAERTIDVTGGGCHDTCRFYKVTATLTGVFFAAPKGPLGGYGHLGCCHLLAIQQVSDVDARRTPVPAAGRFECSTETWHMGVAEAKALQDEVNNCNGFAECRRRQFDEVATVAKHWGDQITASNDDHLDQIGDVIWRSPDHLKTYVLEPKLGDSVHHTRSVDGMAVSRILCKAVVAPLPLSTPVGCRRLNSDFATTAKAAKAMANDMIPKHDD